MNSLYKNKQNKNEKRESEMLEYKRNHPFREDWNDWKTIVRNFYSPRVKLMQRYINKGYRVYSNEQVDLEEMYVIDEVQYLCDEYIENLKMIKNSENYVELAYEFFRKGKAYMYADFEDNMWCECTFNCESLFDNTCIAALHHLQAHCIAFIWAIYKNFSKQQRKRVKKYYERLEQIILSMTYKHLRCIDFHVIIKPFNYIHLKNSLLISLYERFYFEKWTTKDLKQIPFIFEYMKNFRTPISQGGHVTCQSFSDMTVLSNECAQELYNFVNNKSFDDIVKYFNVRSQGLFTFNHDLNLTDNSIEKLRSLLNESQNNFAETMRETLLGTGQKMCAMFAIAVTVSMLSRIAVGVGVAVVMKMLHTVYLFMTKGMYTEEISNSLARSQSGKDCSIPFIPTLILNYIISPPKDLLTKIWKNPNIDIIMRRIGFLGDVKIDRGIERLIDWVKEIIRKIQQWYGQDVLGVSCGLHGFYESEKSPLLSWYEEVDEICMQYFRDEFRWTELEYQIVYNLYKQGLSLIRNQEFSKQKNDVYRIIRQLTTILEKFKLKGICNQNIRNPPVTIYLYGNTGVGKSSITYPLAVEILKAIHDREGSQINLKKEWKNMIYMRAPEQEYWDGYENQLVTVFDDFSQQIDAQQNPNVELFEIIRSSNCFPYPLHMANLEQKASTTFTSKIIIVSSNLQSPQCASLNFPEALKRRFDICIEVDREYTGHTNAFDPTLYKLKKFDMITGISSGSIDYKGLVNDCVDAYFGRKNFVTTIENYIDSILDAGVDTVDMEIPQSQGGGLDDINKENYVDAIEDQEYVSNVPTPQQFVQQVIENKPLQDHMDKIMKRLLREEASKIGVEPGLFEAKFRVVQPGCSKWVEEIDKEEEFNTKGKDPFWLLSYYVVESVRKTRDTLTSSWNQFKEKHSYLSKALIAFSFVTVGLTFLKVFFSMKSMFGNEVIEDKVRPARSVKNVISEGYNVAKSTVAKIESYVAPKATVAKIESYTPSKVLIAKKESIATSEGVKDINATEIMMKIVRTNLYKMFESTQNTPIGHVLFLKGKIAVMPKHFLGGFSQSLRNDPEAYVYFENAFLERTFSIKIKDLLSTRIDYESPCEEDGPVSSRDLMCFSVKTSIYHSDATNYFVTKPSMYRVDSSDIMLPVLVTNRHKDSNKSCLLIRYAQGRSQLECVERLPVADEGDVIARFIRNAYAYNLDTQETECGAPLIVRNSLIQPGKICGFHIAGICGTGQGWATCFYREDCESILSKFLEQDTTTVEIKNKLAEFPKEQGRIPENTQFIHIGKFERKVAQPSKSQIIPSPLYGKIQEPKTRPCLLTKTPDFDPRSYRLSRLGNITECLDERMIECAKDALVDEISSVFTSNKENINNNCKANYSFEEACVGIEGENYINSVKRDTSSGFPFIFMQNFSRKDIFGNKEEYDLNTPQCEILKKRVMNIIDSAKNNVALDHIFMDTLKDERKPIFKSHKTRLFSAGPIDYLIACKMYFNGIVSLLSINRNTCHISVGTNVYSNDWHNIVRVLHNKSKLLVAGDFEGFDASQHQRLLEASLEVLIELSKRFLGSTEEDIKVMRVLGVSLVNSMHIMDDLVYQWTHSLPSGHYLTAIINSIFVNLAFGCVWQLNKKYFSYRIARSFWKKCGIVAYGDDHIVSIPESEIKDFNQFTMPKLMKQIGLSYTMEEKEAEVLTPFRKIDEINYLKRGFLFDKTLNRYICPLQIDTVLEFPMWNHKCPDQKAQTIVELEKCIEELSLHKPEIWQRYIDILIDCGRTLGHYTENIDQEETRLVALGQSIFI